MHNMAASQICSFCDKTFITPDALTIHLISHWVQNGQEHRTEAPKDTNVCREQREGSSYQQDMFKDVSAVSQDEVIDLTDEVVSTDHSALSHSEVAKSTKGKEVDLEGHGLTGRDNESEMSDGSEDSDEEVYECRICGNSFSEISNLLAHTLSHNDHSDIISDKSDSENITHSRNIQNGEGPSTSIAEHNPRTEVINGNEKPKGKSGSDKENCNGQHTDEPNVAIVDSNVLSNNFPDVIDLTDEVPSQSGMQSSQNTDASKDMGENSFKHLQNCLKGIEACQLQLQPHVSNNHYLNSNLDNAQVLENPTSVDLASLDLERRPYTCQTCFTSFKRKAALANHMVCHSDKRPYKCEICGMDFKKQGHLSAHMVQQGSHHKMPVFQKVTPVFRTRSAPHFQQNKYKCKTCGKYFTTIASLQYHNKKHTKQSLSHSHIVTNHSTVEAQHKPYTCGTCGRTFGSINILLYHADRAHNEDRPHKCEKCERAFKKQHHLDQHMCTHKHIEPQPYRSISPTRSSTVDNYQQQVVQLSTLDNYQQPVTQPSMLDNYQQPVTQPSMLDNYQQPVTQPSTLNNFQQPVTQPSMLDIYQQPVTQPSMLDNYQPPVTQPSILDNYQQHVTQPSTLDDYQQPVTQPSTLNNYQQPVTQPSTLNNYQQPVTQPSMLDNYQQPVTQPSTLNNYQQHVTQPSTLNNYQQHVTQSHTVREYLQQATQFTIMGTLHDRRVIETGTPTSTSTTNHNDVHMAEPTLLPTQTSENGTVCENGTEHSTSETLSENVRKIGNMNHKINHKEYEIPLPVIQHMMSSEGMMKAKNYKCRVCKKECTSEVDLQDHMTRHKTKLLNCDVCDMGFNTQFMLSIHESSHREGLPYSCSQCGRGFKQQSSLDTHIAENPKCYRKPPQTSKPWPFLCKICNLRFKSSLKLLKHNKIHNEDRHFKCVICRKGFKTEDHLNLHIGRHCLVCGKHLRSTGSLHNHMLTHTGGNEETPFKCAICGEGFKIKQGFHVHMAKYHEGAEELDVDTSQTSEVTAMVTDPLPNENMANNDSYEANEISTTQYPAPAVPFKSRSDVKVLKEANEQVNHKALPFECGQCGQGFDWVMNLDVHITIAHPELKSSSDLGLFGCKVCGKRFKSYLSLYDHSKVHTKPRPFICVICGEGFNNNDNRRQHMVTHTATISP